MGTTKATTRESTTTKATTSESITTESTLTESTTTESGLKLHAACDDHLTVYVDGSVLIEPINDNWHTAHTVDIPLGSQVIGLACKNKAGPQGIVASLSNGIETDRTWFCSSVDVPGWNLPGFADKNSDFSPAKDGNAYGNGFRPGSIAKTAKVIWGPKLS